MAPLTRFTAHRLELPSHRFGVLHYLRYLPAEPPASAAAPAPLILFLHGAGERGRRVEDVAREGLPRLIEQGTDLPFIVVAPQCPPETWWSVSALTRLLDDVETTLPVDPARVYLTGLSMGGFGSWALAAQQPGRFAAVAPICGGGDPESAAQLAGVPIWAFHGARDDIVPQSRSDEMVAAVRAAGGDPRYTVYPDLAHDSWTVTYENPELYAWFLQHVRERVATGAAH